MFTNGFDLRIRQSHEIIKPEERSVCLSIEHNDDLSLHVTYRYIEGWDNIFRDIDKVLFSEFSTELTSIKDLGRFVAFEIYDVENAFVRLIITELQEFELEVWVEDHSSGHRIPFSEFSQTVTNVDSFNAFIDSRYGGVR
jgi:hypothetical protein